MKSEDIGVGVISVFPPKGLKHAGFGGVASYTANLIASLTDRCRVVVFADKSSGAGGAYCENGVWIHNCWSKSLFYPFQIFWSVARKRGEIDVLHVHHEYFLFGGPLSAVLFPFLLCLLRLLNKPIVVTLHGVISPSFVDRKFLKDNMVSGSPFALRLGAFVLTTLIACFAEVLVVHREFFRRILVCEYGASEGKVCVIPHGVEKSSEVVNGDKAKEILGVAGKKVLLFFGYIAGYKGVELLIDAFDFLKKDEDFVLFVAGGMHPRLRGKRKYQEYLQELKERSRRVSDRIIFTGFVPEDTIPIYFSAADLVIFPYKAAISSSGPLSLAIRYEKQFLVSEQLYQTIEKDHSISYFRPGELADKISEFFSKNKNEELIGYSRFMQKRLDWSETAKRHLSLYQEFKLNWSDHG